MNYWNEDEESRMQENRADFQNDKTGLVTDHCSSKLLPGLDMRTSK